MTICDALPPDAQSGFLSEAACHDLLRRLTRVVADGGSTGVTIRSRWAANVRWARNQVSTAGETQMNWITVEREIRGARDCVDINDTTDAALVAAARRAERLVKLRNEARDVVGGHVPLEPATTPALFSEGTAQLDAAQRAETAHRVAQAAVQAGVLSAGYLEMSATSIAALDTFGRVRYFQYTDAQYSVTVRDHTGTGSGWAGDTAYDWSRLDVPALSAVALDKCVQSRHPVAIEPGRYTVILEPQSVCDLLSQLFSTYFEIDYDRNLREIPLGPFYKPGGTLLGEQVVDARVTIGADPMDPALGFPPFNPNYLGTAANFFERGPVYHATNWIEQGVLTHLAYDRQFAVGELGKPTGLPNSGAFRMSGGTTSLEEMIATTRRGVLVTRFDSVFVFESHSQLCRGYTRDGLWLIEDGKVSKAIKNMAFTESILFVLNNIEQLGVPKRAFHPIPPYFYTRQPQPVIVPALKIRDFSFTALADAV